MLVYTSEVLSDPLEVTGPVKVVLFAKSSAKDTDWTAKLVDVDPDGRAFNLCDGIIRARNRDGRKPQLITPVMWLTAMARHQFRSRILLLAVSSFGLSLGLLKMDTYVHSSGLGVTVFCCLGASIGWPIGYFLGGRPGAAAGIRSRHYRTLRRDCHLAGQH